VFANSVKESGEVDAKRHNSV